MAVLKKETYKDHGYEFVFLQVGSIQMKIEPTKASIGNYLDLAPDLKILDQYKVHVSTNTTVYN